MAGFSKTLRSLDRKRNPEKKPILPETSAPAYFLIKGTILLHKTSALHICIKYFSYGQIWLSSVNL